MAVPDILELCKEFAALPIGTVVMFEEGVDFITKPVSFRNKLHREMRNDGFIVESMLRDGAVYAKVKRVYGADAKSAVDPEEPAAPKVEETGPSYGLLSPTNPLVPAAVFRVPAG